MAMTLVDAYTLAAAAAPEVCLFACALTALWWGNSRTREDLRSRRSNSKSPKKLLADLPGAAAASPPKRDDCAQFTSVYDLALWRLHASAEQPAAAPARTAAPVPHAGGEPPASPGGAGPGLDFQAFLDSLEQHCDLALDGLCDQVMGEQGASVLMDLERDYDYEALGDSALPMMQLDTELPRDMVPKPEDEQDRAYDDVCDSALADLELDMKPFRDAMQEPERERDRAYDDMYASYQADLDELNWRMFGDVESTSSQQLSCTSLHGRIIQSIRQTVDEYMLWTI